MRQWLVFLIFFILFSIFRAKDSRAMAYEGLCNDLEDFHQDMSSADLEAIDKATAEHLAESSQTSSSLVNYPQLEGLQGNHAGGERPPVEERDDDDIPGSPIIPINNRLKVKYFNL